jgi:hypothetical protein
LWQSFHCKVHDYILNQHLVIMLIINGSIMLAFVSFCLVLARMLTIWLSSLLYLSWLWLLVMVWLHHTCTSQLQWGKVFTLDALVFVFSQVFFLLVRVAIWLQVVNSMSSFCWAQAMPTFHHACVVPTFHCAWVAPTFHRMK